MCSSFTQLWLRAVLCCVLTWSALGAADITEDLLKGALVEGVTVDLREPEFSEGVLTTNQGGVITGPNGIRIQAKHIVYTRKKVEGCPICTIQAEEDLILEFGDYIFVGDSLEYDFQTCSGVIFCARTGIHPWFVSGEAIYLLPDGSYHLDRGHFTTSEVYPFDWEIRAGHATLQENQLLCAQDVQFRIFNIPVFWLPSFSMGLDAIYDHPFRYTVGWGGRQGPRIGMAYEIFSWNRWHTFLRLDWRLRRGFGGGLEVQYSSPDRREFFECINYVAQDASIFMPHEHIRYRFQGAYHNSWDCGRLTLDMTYDKLSDKDMATDYADQGLDLEIDGITELDIRRQAPTWIAQFVARPRFNGFETIKQELPTVFCNWKPFVFGNTGIIGEPQLRVSYLDFVYANSFPHVHDYNATRFEFSQRCYRPFYVGPVTATPEVGSTMIFYGNSPEHDARWLAVGTLGCDISAPFYRYFPNGKHVVVPYANYHYYTFPTVSPNRHYIFDITDGWYRQSMMSFGVNQSWYTTDFRGCIRRFLFADVHANAFFDVDTVPHSIPRAYATVVVYPTYTLKHTVDTVWNFDRNQLDHINLRTQWTVSQDLAVAAEYRHRGAFDWRKADHTNFVLDAFRSMEELRASAVSAKRDTFLLSFFYRFHPNWAIEYESRHGWHRRDHTRFNEFEVDLLGSLPSSSEVKLSYQHNEGEDRVAVYFTVGLQRPDRWKASDFVPFLEF